MNLSRSGAGFATLATLTFAVFCLPAEAVAGACDITTTLAKTACDLNASSDFNYAAGTCANLSSPPDRAQCLTRATHAQTAAVQLCVDQAAARNQVCHAIGQAPYDPEIVPADFSATINNPFLPWKPGSVWVYKNGDARITVTVMPRTIKLGGVTCVVVHDVNTVNGKIEEDTLDYYAQHKDGSVWYFGEDTVAFNRGIADTAGSWRTGVAGGKPGVIMPAHPQAQLGKTYRQEFRLGAAEDMARNIAVNQHVSVPFGTFSNAFQTREFSPLEPGAAENKYFVPGIGNVLVVDLDTGEREELVSFAPGS